MTALVLLAAAAVSADSAQQTWIEQLREADRLRSGTCEKSRDVTDEAHRTHHSQQRHADECEERRIPESHFGSIHLTALVSFLLIQGKSLSPSPTVIERVL